MLCDTGVLIDAMSVSKKKSEACRRALSSASTPLITTWPCIAEAMHILGKRGGGWPIQSRLAGLIEGSLLNPYDIQRTDFSRLFFLMAQYKDRPMDLGDASLVLAAEKTGERKILTLDSDFRFYRINNRDSFDVIEI